MNYCVVRIENGNEVYRSEPTSKEEADYAASIVGMLSDGIDVMVVPE